MSRRMEDRDRRIDYRFHHVMKLATGTIPNSGFSRTIDQEYIKFQSAIVPNEL
jgi:hypothetical protein